MIKINLNDMQYRYDVYHIVKLFFDFSSIEFVDEECDYKVDIYDNRLNIASGNDVKEFLFDERFTIKEEVKKAVFKYFSTRTNKELPWGTLIGIRPSKIAMKMLEQGKNYDDIIRYFNDAYLTRRDKAKLCIEVAENEKKYLNTNSNMVSIYIGMPFCPTRCLYCSFASNPIHKSKELIIPYLETLKYEITQISRYIDNKGLKIQSVYFGGGTPTSVNDENFEEIMKTISEYFVLNRDIQEFTVECGRPDSITINKLQTMKRYSVDRISINPQSMNDETLRLIGRNHNCYDIIEKYEMARSLGFDNINMDIIVGLPGEKLSHIENTCEKILKLKPDSLTVHGLSIKRASRLYENIINNLRYEIPKQHELNKMYERTARLAYELSMKPYYMYRQKNMVGNMENIGYSLEGKECIYNIEMIEDRQTIIALGADSVSKVVYNDTGKIDRFGNVKDVKEYLKRIDEMIKNKLKLLDSFVREEL
ncbi:oxygen-independent coproporphyrinogen-III oxidase-like protein HemZ [Clostridium tepidiprofundi DSM 19306]|uniref:Oxygen-independent coproporphyrinogen-III oxidase-like protein HemZ n=1 Tax=Clostridium tepidiprofundi DSM 19306 TaxID=1121338 RepID=A0A151B7Y4_9CLOT|nr:coproporphyrinogen III oxidase [Clostridium tepidiprofundi]KYH36016.1 oxygen-independent coproporphyrinogen-III oxidase-like protein HemZ [Clostridium tepidiprofundi DSM 19306]